MRIYLNRAVDGRVRSASQQRGRFIASKGELKAK